MSSEMVLTAEQRAAAGHPPTPLRIIAGAGTGKTTVLVARIAELVRSGACRADQVLAMTFTNKAAADLSAKVRDRLGPDTGVQVTTYHGFGASLVMSHRLELDLHPGVRLLDRAQAWQLLFGVFDEFRFSKRRVLKPGLVVTDALTLASRCADHLVAVAEVAADAARVAADGRWARQREAALGRLELCQVVEAYERRKRERHLIDYSDQIRLAVGLLRGSPDLTGALREQYQVVLLDEYQDTNYAQRVLLELLAGPGVTAVGDDMQSIYAFRGAHLQNLVDFGRYFAPLSDQRLVTNRRSGPEIVALANRIQAQVPGALEKELLPLEGAAPSELSCFLAADDVEEATQIAADVAAAGPPWSESAVLCRKRKLIPAIADALEGAGIPAEVVGTSGLLGRPEVVDVQSWLELLADPGSTPSLLRLLTQAPVRLGWRDLAAVARRARVSTYREAIETAGGEPDLSMEAQRRLAEFVRTWHDLQRAAARLPVPDLVEAIIARTDLWARVSEAGTENLLRLVDLAACFEPVEASAGVGLAGFVAYLQLLDESEEDLSEAHPGGTDAVRVLTVHQAKGLEWDRVWVPGLAGAPTDRRSGIFPDSRGGDNPLGQQAALPWELRPDDPGMPDWRQAGVRQADIDAAVRDRAGREEWRLFYVACTRARRQLVLSAAQWYPGPATPQGPSIFYDFVAGQTDLVHERFRHDPTGIDPRVAAMGRREARAVAAERAASAEGGSPDAAAGGPGPLFGTAASRPARSTGPLSVTSLIHYRRCPRQFYWLAVRPLPRRSGAGARIGTEIHHWIEQRSDPQQRLFADEPAVDRRGESGADGSFRDRVHGLRAAFEASPFGVRHPARSEAAFALTAGGRAIRGRVDAVYQDDGRTEVVDFKTGRAPLEDDPGGHVQLDLYALAAAELWGADPTRLRTSYCYLRPDGTSTVITDDWDHARLVEARAALDRAVEGIGTGRFDVAPGSWCTRCDWQSVCPAARDHLDQ